MLKKELVVSNSVISNGMEALDNLVIYEQIKQLNENDIANKTSAGFIYQDLVLIKKLLNLENNSTKIGYEILDDIHVLTENGLELIQIKHSVNDDNLSESSSDFWKTIDKWAKIIKSTNSSNLKFIFYTNRKISINSDLFNALKKEIKDYKNIKIIINDLFIKLDKKEDIKMKGQSINPIYKYVKNINELEDKNKELLFEKLMFITSEKQIIDEIKEKIKYFGIDKPQDIDNIYEQLLGIITDKRYELAKKDSDFLIDYNYFRNNLKFNQLLKISKIEPIDFDKYYSFENKYDEDIYQKIFYKQLVDIDVTDKDINDYARERAKASSFFDELNLLKNEENIINQKIIEEWEEIHIGIYEENIINENIHKNKAKECLKETKKSNITYKSSDLPKSLIKGKLIDLSDKPIIGWRKDWKEKYYE